MSDLPKFTESELWSQDSKLQLLHSRHCINIILYCIKLGEFTSPDESHQGCQAQSWECVLWNGSATAVGWTPHPAMIMYIVCEPGRVLACSQRQMDYDFSYEANFWLITLNSCKGELEVLCARLRSWANKRPTKCCTFNLSVLGYSQIHSSLFTSMDYTWPV